MVENIQGVSIRVSLRGASGASQGMLLFPPKSGFLGKFSPASGQISLEVMVGQVSSERIFALTVDMQKNVMVKKNLERNPDNGARYRSFVPIRLSSGGTPVAEEAHNCIRLLEFYGNTGFHTNGLRVWEVAIVSQNGDFFLSVQKEYDADLWQKPSGAGLFITEQKLMNWAQMRDAIDKLFPKTWAPLPLPSSIGFKADSFAGESLPRGVARVKWYSPRSGLGALRTPNGDARVHWTQVVPRDGFSYLVADELVTYDRLRAPLEASGRKTAFSLEALEVEAIPSDPPTAGTIIGE